MIFELSELDTNRFGIIIAKVKDFNKEDIHEINSRCKENIVRMLIARIATTELATAQALENDGFQLMDTIVYYQFDYSKKGTSQPIGTIQLRNISGDHYSAGVVKDIAKSTFAGYMGHYHSDPMLDSEKCDEAYVDWAYRSCIDSNVSDAVVSPMIEDQIAGFGTLKIHSPVLGEIILAGVSPSYQKQGLYQAIILGGMNWLHSNGCTQIILSTQITNIAVQKVWARCGFEMSHSYYTFHKWFNQ